MATAGSFLLTGTGIAVHTQQSAAATTSSTLILAIFIPLLCAESVRFRLEYSYCFGVPLYMQLPFIVYVHECGGWYFLFAKHPTQKQMNLSFVVAARYQNTQPLTINEIAF